MSSRYIGHVLDNEAQRAVLRGDCYYCWLGQYDKCDANCNNRRSIPKYGNHDITPSGKFKIKSAVGAQSHSEWLTSQNESQTSAVQDSSRRPDGSRSHSVGVGGQAGRLSRFEIIQDRQKAWALRNPLGVPPPKLSSLGAGVMGDGEDGSGVTLTSVAYYGGGGNGILSTQNFAKKAPGAKEPTSNEGERPAHLIINSCRLPKQTEIPHKHAAGVVKVQITPYSFAEIASRSSLIANERQKEAEERLRATIHRDHVEQSYNHRSDVARQAAGEEDFGIAQRYRQQSYEQHRQNYGDYDQMYDTSSQRAPTPTRRSTSRTANSRSSSVNASRPLVQRGKGGVVLSTRAPSVGGGPVLKVRSDDTSSYILTHKVQSVRNMPLPDLFQGLD